MRRRIEDIKCEPGFEFDYLLIKYLLSRKPTLHYVPTPRQLNYLRTEVEKINHYRRYEDSHDSFEEDSFSLTDLKEKLLDLWINEDIAKELSSKEAHYFFQSVFDNQESYPIKVYSPTFGKPYIKYFGLQLFEIIESIVPYHNSYKQTYGRILNEDQYFWFDIANSDWCNFERNFSDSCVTNYAIWEVYFYDKTKSNKHEEIDIEIDDVPNTKRGYFKRRCREDNLWGYDYYINFYDIDQGNFFPIDKITVFRLISVCYRVAGDKKIIGDFIHQVSDYEEAMRNERWDSQKGNYPDYTNSRYYNDNLDLDQQSPEFWDDI